jgi:hypothetical protein
MPLLQRTTISFDGRRRAAQPAARDDAGVPGRIVATFFLFPFTAALLALVPFFAHSFAPLLFAFATIAFLHGWLLSGQR